MSLFNFGHRTFRLALAGVTLAIGGGAMAIGCGGADLSTPNGFCAAVAAADCSISIVQACLGSSDATLQTDTDRCVAARSKLTTCNPSNLTYHPDFADACIAQHQLVFSSTSIDSTSYQSLVEACLPVFNQGRPQGAACKLDSDCDVGFAGLRCLTRVGGNGTCQVPNPVEGGSSCKDPTAQCPDAQYCDSNFHCVEVGLKGDACGAGEPCGTGTRCNKDLNQCVNQLANGEKCAADGDCAGGFCLGAADGSSRCAGSLVFAQGSSICLDFTQF
jgi:hypothetical protein